MATTSGDTTFDAVELAQATRNHGMPLEALRYDVTPVGLHYLLIHYDIPEIDAATWRLQVAGLVNHELSLSLDDLKARGTVERHVVMECAGNGRATFSPRALSQPWGHEAVGCARWTGTPLIAILDEAGVHPGGVDVVFTGADRGVEGGQAQTYARSLSIEEAWNSDVLLVHTVNGQPLPPQHGAPVRLLVPGWYGMTSVKWLQRIDVLDEPFTGYQQTVSYRISDDTGEAGEPVNRIAVRSLMIPPGVPTFPERDRLLDAGTVRLQGRAWSGIAGIDRVEVSADDGGSWWDADVTPPHDPDAWSSWTTTWEATPGDHVLVTRATDHAGVTQPREPAWNRGGYMGNGWQRVPVTVA